MVFKFPKLFTSYPDWLEKQQSSILSAALFISVASIISGVSGLLRYRMLYSIFGDAPQEFEGFLVAFQLPEMMYKLVILGALSAAFIPIFSQYKKESEHEAFYMTSVLMNVLLGIFGLLGVVVYFFAEPLTLLQTGPKFHEHPEIIAITANSTRIMVLAQFFFAISNFFMGILQSYKRFILPALAPIIYNVGIVVSAYFLQSFLGIYAAAWAVVIGAFLHMIIQLPTVLKLGFRYTPSFNFAHTGFKRVMRLTPARTFTLGITEVQDLFLGKIVTSIGNLSYVIFTYSMNLMTFPIRFFGVPISQAALPFLSDESNENDLTTFRDLVLKLIHQISFFVFPASVLLLILRVPIVRLAYGTPNFTWQSTLLTAKVVAIISLSITAQAVVQLLIRAFYALKNTKVPLYISFVTAILYVSISALGVFVFHQGMIGVAVAITISAIVEMLLLLFFLDRKVKGFAQKAFWIPQLKMITASFLMAVFLYLPFKILDQLVFNTSRTVELIMLTITTSTIGMLVYIYFAALFDIRELYILQQLIDKFGTWKKTLARSPEVILETAGERDDL